MMEERLIQLEAEAERLQQDIADLRTRFIQDQQLEILERENRAMRQAILRYSIACGTVDLQMALLKARHERTPEALDQLKEATLEEETASRSLRDLAQQLQMAQQERQPESAD